MGSTAVRTVIGDVVAELAPEEMPVLAALDHLDDPTVLRMLRGRRRTEALGFGLAEVAAVVTPIVWLAVDEACRAAVAGTVESARGRFTRGARRLLRRQPAPDAPAVEAGTEDGAATGADADTRTEPGTGAGQAVVPTLTREQLEVVHRRVLADAGAVGLPTADATVLADRVVARLVLAAPPGSARPSEEGGVGIAG
ncbi:hypothetical protein [Streptomyces sp. NPDC056549]|uniref:hypothetical protein n=1 Tax=Streptomyces sp. NPDC056549 TaxID=3345864 RepID=UPI003699925E